MNKIEEQESKHNDGNEKEFEQPDHDHIQAKCACKCSNDATEGDTASSKWWISSDSQSTMDIFCNENLIADICQVKNGIDLHINGGDLEVT